jgi:hypothetical protein
MSQEQSDVACALRSAPPATAHNATEVSAATVTTTISRDGHCNQRTAEVDEACRVEVRTPVEDPALSR